VPVFREIDHEIVELAPVVDGRVPEPVG